MATKFSCAQIREQIEKYPKAVEWNKHVVDHALAEKWISEVEQRELLALIGSSEDHSDEVNQIRKMLIWMYHHKNWQKPFAQEKIYPWLNKGDYVLKANNANGFLILIDLYGEIKELFGKLTNDSLLKINKYFKNRNSINSKNYFSENGVPYEPDKGSQNIRNYLPISHLINKKIGECVTMGIICKLISQQYGEESYLIGGTFEKEEIGQGEQHTWVIILRKGNYFVFDPALGNSFPIAKIQKTKQSYGTDISIVPKEGAPAYFNFIKCRVSESKCNGTYFFN